MPPLTAALLAFGRARLRPGLVRVSTIGALESSPASAESREPAYWQAAALGANRNSREALAAVDAELAVPDAMRTDEREWRLAALGAACARALGLESRTAELAARARTVRGRLRDRWKDEATAYERRPDLVELVRQAGL